MSTWFTAFLICMGLFSIRPGWCADAGHLSLYDVNFRAEFDSATGRLTALGGGKGRVPIVPSGGGFSAYDFKTKREIPFTPRVPTRAGQGISSVWSGENLLCEVEYKALDQGVMVTGKLRGSPPITRAVVLSYTIPLAGEKLVFSPSLNQTVAVDAQTSGKGSVYPIAAMSGRVFGVAMAIPPTAPCMFNMVGSAEGLTLRMYLGLSPYTKPPGTASFSFMIYECDAQWGFRDALRRYYDTFPDFYRHHGSRDGLWMFQTSGPPNLGDFLYDETSMSVDYSETLARDHKNGQLTFPYMIVGQREIKNLNGLPKSYEEAMAAYDAWSPPENALNVKEALAAGGDVFLKHEVESSALKNHDGEYNIQIRNTDWGGDSVTFVMNPDPDLFEGTGKHTTGGDAMLRIHEWLKSYPATDGIYIDSLGANWCAKLNYRRDHFRYADIPLTFDKDGNVCLHNQLSHYEFLQPIRDELHREGKLLMANGVYNYTPKEIEYADVKDTGRFFLAALVDIAGAESSTPSQDRCEFYRAAMSQKPYLVLKYHWENVDNVQEVFNHCLCYGVLVTCSNGLGKTYWTDPNGYPRDKSLYEWYVPLVRTLSKAGWEPVTWASSPTEGLRFERYGSGDEVYFTIYNTGPEQECALYIDTVSLHLGKDLKIEQISGPGFISAETSGGRLTVRTKIASNRTAVIRVSS